MSYGRLDVNISGQVVTVATLAALPPPDQVPIGSVRVTQDDGDMYVNDGATWHLLGGGSAAGVDSVNGHAGVVTTAEVLEGYGVGNAFSGFDNTGLLTNIPGWSFNDAPINGSSNVQLTYQPNNLAAFENTFIFNVNIDPLQNSPDDGLNILSVNANLDSAATGFNMGTNGRSVTLVQGGFNDGGDGSTYGQLAYCSFSSGIGNGTDPVTVKGINYFEGFFNLAPNATMDGQIRGFLFQPNLDASSNSTSNFRITAYGDFSNIGTPVNGYDAFVSNPSLASITNNNNFNGFNVGPTIATMTGNAGFTAFGCFANITTLGTGGFQGLNINPDLGTFAANSGFGGVYVGATITTMGTNCNYSGVNVNPRVTSTTGSITCFQANPQATGGNADVSLYQGNMSQVTGSGNPSVLNLSGLTADNKQSQFNADNVHMSIGGVLQAASNEGVQSQHVIFTQYSTPNAAITGTDVLINVLSPDLDFGPIGASVALGPDGLGTCMVAFAGQAHGHGQMAQLSAVLPGAIFSEDFTLGDYRGVNAAMINAGYTGVCTNATAFYHEVTGAGLFAVNHWGLRVVTDVDNYVTRLAINTATQKVTNASVALEIGGTDRAMMVGSLTTTQKNALTALNGMLCYDTTLNKFQGYEAGAWVNLI